MPEIRLHRIRITDDELAECEGNTPLVRIRRDEIVSVRVVMDAVISEHPLFLWLVTAVCGAAAVIGVLLLVHGGWEWPKTAALLISLALLTPFSLGAAIRRGPVLLVKTRRGQRKLGFGADIAPEELAWFLDHASRQGRLPISADLPRAQLESAIRKE